MNRIDPRRFCVKKRELLEINELELENDVIKLTLANL